MNIVVDSFLLLVIILMLTSFRKQNKNEDYLSIDKCNVLRGILAIFIVLHHLSEKYPIGYIFPKLQHLGYLIVAVFFFLSGYGLMCSYQKKGVKYFDGYWKKRIGYLFLVYFIITIAYFVCYNLMGIDISFVELLKSFVNGHPVITNSWYISVQLFFYILFWFVFKLMNRVSDNIKIMITLILTVGIMALFYFSGLDSFWYLSDLAFVVGLFFAKNRDKIDTIIMKYYYVIFILIFLGFVLFSIMPSILYRLGIEFALIYPLCRNISSIFFTLMVIIAFVKINLKSKLWDFFGKISLELYLVHELVISILGKNLSNEVLVVILTLVISVVLAYFANFINKFIAKQIKAK